MATEIIKTDDPNIVIERTVTENTVDLEKITGEIGEINKLIDVLLEKRLTLENIDGLPAFIKEIVLRERDVLDADISFYQNKIAELNEFLIA